MKTLRVLLLFPLIFLVSCEKEQRAQVNYEMGERVAIGPLSVVVVESAWRSEFGEGFQTRAAKNRFLVLTLSITNGGAEETSVPLLQVESSSGTPYQELSDGAGVANWLGVLRSVGSAETLQGRVVFDVPLGAYRLRLPESGESGYEKYVWVNIPLSLDSGQVQAPLPTTVR